MAKRKRHPYLDQARAAALVKYGPEISGLLELARQARENMSGSVASAKGSSAAITNAIDEARPQVQKVYTDADSRQGVLAAQVAAHTSTLGPVADSIKAAAASEAGAAASRIGESRAAALTSLDQQRVGAQEGRQFAIQQARKTFATDIGKVLNRRQDLLHEQGAYTAQTAQELRDKARADRLTLRMNHEDNAQSNTNSIRSSGIDPKTGKPIAGGKLDPKVKAKKGQLTPLQQAAAADKAAEALGWGEKFRAKGTSFEKAKLVLTDGFKAQKEKTVPVYDKATGKKKLNPDGTPQVKVVTPALGAIPQVKSELLLQAALEVAYHGNLTPATKRRLRQRGINPRQFEVGLIKGRSPTPPASARPPMG